MANVVCFGEVLWDVFQNHKKIGGAPLNVAVRLKSLDNNVSIISSVGADVNGDEILAFLNKKNINTDGVQIDSNNNTGEVKVRLNEKGSASYDIIYQMAWDKIKVKDTVGAGDSFLASLISKLLQNISGQEAVNYASTVGALVAQSEGANPILLDYDINALVN